MHHIAIRYAQSLLQQAALQQLSKDVYTDIQLIAQTCTEHPALVAVLQNPTIQRGKKASLLQATFQDKLQPLTRSFLALVAQKRRAALLPAIAHAFLAQYDKQQGIQTAHVITASPLSDTLAKQLKSLVQSIAPCQQVVLDQHVEPAIVGGYVLEVAGKRLDQSLHQQLQSVHKQCIAEGY